MHGCAGKTRVCCRFRPFVCRCSVMHGCAGKTRVCCRFRPFLYRCSVMHGCAGKTRVCCKSQGVPPHPFVASGHLDGGFSVFVSLYLTYLKSCTWLIWRVFFKFVLIWRVVLDLSEELYLTYLKNCTWLIWRVVLDIPEELYSTYLKSVFVSLYLTYLKSGTKKCMLAWNDEESLTSP